MADSAQILISASFPPDFSLTCGHDITMCLNVRKLNRFPCDMYLQNFQMLLVGYTDIRAGTVAHGQIEFWIIQSLSNLGLKNGSADDNVGTVREIDPSLWKGKTLPESVIPSFETCNVDRRYVLEILMGFQCWSLKVCRLQRLNSTAFTKLTGTTGACLVR
jgi:hypothetical protein